MKFEFAEQYNVPCAHLDSNDVATLGETIIEICYQNECTYNDGEDVCLVISFEDRPPELYTERALRLSLKEGR
jgi:hypothetical protein